MSNYEPPAEMVAIEVDRIMSLNRRFPTFDDIARSNLRRQHEREKPLLVAMEKAHTSLDGGYDHPSWGRAYLKEALAAHAALDAPKVPSVGDAFRLAEASRFVDDAEPDVHIRKSAWDTLKAAVEREEKR